VPAAVEEPRAGGGGTGLRSPLLFYGGKGGDTCAQLRFGSHTKKKGPENKRRIFLHAAKSIERFSSPLIGMDDMGPLRAAAAALFA